MSAEEDSLFIKRVRAIQGAWRRHQAAQRILIEACEVIFPSEGGFGYLAAVPRDQVVLLYAGISPEDEGWVFARRLRDASPGVESHGWLAASTLNRVQLGDIGMCVRSYTTTPHSGYLNIRTLDGVLIVYVGTEGEEAGWVFARHAVTSDDTGGWLNANRLVALHKVPMCGASCT